MVNMDEWVKTDERLRKNALAGKERRRFEFELVDAVDIHHMKEEDVFDFIDITVEFHAIAYNTTKEQAQKQVYSNLLYIAGYYDKETCDKWREIVHHRMGYPNSQLTEDELKKEGSE